MDVPQGSAKVVIIAQFLPPPDPTSFLSLRQQDINPQ